MISFIDFETHGYHYLRSMHGPAWVAKPTEAEEREVVDAIVDTVKKADKSIAFLRIDTVRRWYGEGAVHSAVRPDRGHRHHRWR